MSRRASARHSGGARTVGAGIDAHLRERKRTGDPVDSQRRMVGLEDGHRLSGWPVVLLRQRLVVEPHRSERELQTGNARTGGPDRQPGIADTPRQLGNISPACRRRCRSRRTRDVEHQRPSWRSASRSGAAVSRTYSAVDGSRPCRTTQHLDDHARSAPRRLSVVRGHPVVQPRRSMTWPARAFVSAGTTRRRRRARLGGRRCTPAPTR